MGNSLVEYIHRSYKNYAAFGLERTKGRDAGGSQNYPGSVLRDAANDIVQNRLETMAQVPELLLQILADQAAAYMKPDSQGQTGVDKIRKDLDVAWEEARKDMDNVLAKGTIDKTTSTGGVIRSYSKEVQELNSKKDAFDKLISRLLRKGSASKSELEQVKALSEALIRELKELNITFEGCIGWDKIPSNLSQAKVLKNTVNKVLSKPALGIRKGNFGEIIVEDINNCAKDIIIANADKIFTEGKIEGVTVQNVGADPKISSVRKDILMGANKLKDEFRIYVEDKKVQNKVDILVQYNDSTSFGQTVKNYDFSANNQIGFLSGNLIRMLRQTDEEITFLKHFVNIYASHLDGKEANGDSEGSIQSARSVAAVEFKKVAAAYAIVGSSLKSENIQDVAEIFFVIDSSTGNIHVGSTAKLVSNLLGATEQIFVYLGGKTLGKDSIFYQGVFKGKRRQEYGEQDPNIQIAIRLGNVQREILGKTISVKIAQQAIINAAVRNKT